MRPLVPRGAAWDTAAMSRAGGGKLFVAAAVAVSIGCAHSSDAQKAHEEATTKGKYAVHLTEESELVSGTCKYIRSIQPDDDPVSIPTNSQLPDYFRVHAVLMGADTVVVRGRVGEAYQCGPEPLNPDGTRRGAYGSPTPGAPH